MTFPPSDEGGGFAARQRRRERQFFAHLISPSVSLRSTAHYSPAGSDSANSASTGCPRPRQRERYIIASQTLNYSLFIIHYSLKELDKLPIYRNDFRRSKSHPIGWLEFLSNQQYFFVISFISSIFFSISATSANCVRARTKLWSA